MFSFAFSWFTSETFYNSKFTDDDNFNASLLYVNKSEIRDGRYNTFFRTNWMGTFHYDLKDKYIADVTLAFNGSNRSYPAKWSFSPTVALGWIFANDADASVLNYGKLRASFGILHTDYVPDNNIWSSAWDAGHGAVYFGKGYNQLWGAFIQRFPNTSFSQSSY